MSLVARRGGWSFKPVPESSLLYESNYALMFPYFDVHSVDDEVMIANYNKLKRQEYINFAKDNYVFEDISDFTYIVDQTFSFFNTFYERLALAYANIEFLEYYIARMHRYIHLRSSFPVWRLQCLMDQVTLARNCISIINSKKQELIASQQLSWRALLKTKLDDNMETEWKYIRHRKRKQQQEAQIAAIPTGRRTLYDPQIAVIILEYYMELHPRNQPPIELVEEDNEND